MPSRRASALCLFSALSTTSLAGCCREYWHGEVEPLDSPTQQRLHDVIAEQGRVAVGAGGTVVIGDELVTLDTQADLLAIAERNGEYGDARIAVGTGGTLAVQSDEGPWQLVPSPTSVDLVAVTADEHAFAVGDGVVVGYEFESGEAWLIAQGDGLAWGSLNAIVPAGGDRTLLLGDAGKAWMARGPLEGAVELELGVDVDLHVAGSHEDARRARHRRRLRRLLDRGRAHVRGAAVGSLRERAARRAALGARHRRDAARRRGPRRRSARPARHRDRRGRGPDRRAAVVLIRPRQGVQVIDVISVELHW